MFERLRRLLERRRPVQTVCDPLLGALTYSPNGGWWEAVVALPAGGSLRFQIGGRNEPDSALIQHARDLVSGYPAFLHLVRELLEQEALRTKRSADEIRQLEIEIVSLFWPERPNDGMVFFKELATSDRLWRCEYLGRKPEYLGFDR